MNKENIEREVWRSVPEIPSAEADLYGNIRMLDGVVCDENGTRFIKSGVRKQCDNGTGYLYASVFVDGKWRMKYVHRLVAKAFIPNPNNYPEINHLSGDKTDNSITNLEWCTHQYNIEYREKSGKAQRHPVFAINLNTLDVLRFSSQHGATRSLEVRQGSISNVIKGRYKQAGGYWFTNADSNAVEATRAKFGDKVANKVADLIENNIKST